eukprot:6811716-Pyramimonas_sp.AAC.1
MSFDKNPRQIKLEIATKTVRKTLLELCPSMRFLVDRHTGVVSSQWKPLVKITPKTGNSMPTL